MPSDVTRTVQRARESLGTSNSAAMLSLVRELVCRHTVCDVLVDMGCGTGQLHNLLQGCFTRYVGVDVVEHDGFPRTPDAEFLKLDIDRPGAGLPAAVADVVCCVETIEHLENPRALARQLDALSKPGGLIVITTPNQLSALSKLCLIWKNEFVHFQKGPGLYPAHLSALLECDLKHIAEEMGWQDIAIHYSGEGRVPGGSGHWPAWLSARTGWRGRTFSDNVVLSAVKPHERHLQTPGKPSC